MRRKIYIQRLICLDGTRRNHNGRPTKKFLQNHPEFIKFYEVGYINEYNYRTTFKIENSRLIEISDFESHQRNDNF